MEQLFRIASVLGVWDSNRIAHRGCIARFGPPRWVVFLHFFVFWRFLCASVHFVPAKMVTVGVTGLWFQVCVGDTFETNNKRDLRGDPSWLSGTRCRALQVLPGRFTADFGCKFGADFGTFFGADFWRRYSCWVREFLVQFFWHKAPNRRIAHFKPIGVKGHILPGEQLQCECVALKASASRQVECKAVLSHSLVGGGHK